jgi:negative regulator of sigma E activity
MNPVVSEELISAYLDGELNTEERTLVEQALADSPDLRRFYQDLQGIQAGLRALPRQRSSVDFAARITAQIARDSLRPLPTEDQIVTPARRGAKSKTPAWRSWQVMVPAAASLVAMVLVAVLAVSSWRPDAAAPVRSFVASQAPDGGQRISAPREQVAHGATSIPSPAGGEPGLRDMTRQVGTQEAADDRVPDLVMVMDLTITTVGQKEQVFENTLRKAGIHFDPDIKVDDRLEKAILASRFIGDVDRVPRDGSPPAPADEIEMTFVAGPGRQIDAALRNLQSLPASLIARWQYDLAIEPAERDLFKLLDSAARLASVDERAPRAHRLAFRFSLRPISTGFMGNMARPLMRVELVPKAESPSAPVAAPLGLATEQDAAHVRPAVAAGAADASRATGHPDDEPCEVLFVLRKLASDAVGPDPTK